MAIMIAISLTGDPFCYPMHEGLPIPLQQGNNDASSLLQALVKLSKTCLETCLVLDCDLYFVANLILFVPWNSIALQQLI
jgi:hypothetical protein